MGEACTAIRRKKDSSIARAISLVKEGDADAIFSAGNTGAAVAAATLMLRTLKGVSRPAIAAVIPTSESPYVLLDAGANPDSTPEMLQQFAVMGSIYSRKFWVFLRLESACSALVKRRLKGMKQRRRGLVCLNKRVLNLWEMWRVVIYFRAK